MMMLTRLKVLAIEYDSDCMRNIAYKSMKEQRTTE